MTTEIAALLVTLVRSYAAVATALAASCTLSRDTAVLAPSSASVLSTVASTCAAALAARSPRGSLLPEAHPLATMLCSALLHALTGARAHHRGRVAGGALLRRCGPPVVYTLCCTAAVASATETAAAGVQLVLLMSCPIRGGKASPSREDDHGDAAATGGVDDDADAVAALLGQHMQPLTSLPPSHTAGLLRLVAALALTPQAADVAVAAAAGPALAAAVRRASAAGLLADIEGVESPILNDVISDALRALGALLAGCSSATSRPQLVPDALSLAAQLGPRFVDSMDVLGACCPASGCSTQHLRLARAASFFACQLADAAPGDWELHSPGQMRACRAAATSLLTVVAAGPTGSNTGMPPLRWRLPDRGIAADSPRMRLDVAWFAQDAFTHQPGRGGRTNGAGAATGSHTMACELYACCCSTAAFVLACSRWRAPRNDDVTSGGWPTHSTLRALRAQCVRVREQCDTNGGGAVGDVTPGVRDAQAHGGGEDVARIADALLAACDGLLAVTVV